MSNWMLYSIKNSQVEVVIIEYFIVVYSNNTHKAITTQVPQQKSKYLKRDV